ncbi:MAG: hypothetical protein GY838_15110 [bacterium]|nr:hypothetical protein [bacterium]
MPAIARCRIVFTVAALICVLAAPGLARERIPAPEPVPSAGAFLAADNAPALSAPGQSAGEAPAGEVPGDPARAESPDKAGGVSVLVNGEGWVASSSLAVTSDGDHIVTAGGSITGSTEIFIYRSGDGGVTWSLWGTLGTATGNYWQHARVVVAEGSVDRCYVIGSHFVAGPNVYQTWIAWADLADATPDFDATAVPVMDTAGIEFEKPRLLADDFVTGAFFLYAVAEGDDDAGTDIWFTRSLDFGSTWETPYRIANLNVDDRHYRCPDLALGHGGRLHVAYQFDHGTTTLDDAIRVRSVPSYGDGGAASWESVRALTTTSNGIEEYEPCIGASWTSDQVVITERRGVYSGSYISVRSPGIFVSADAGSSFTETISGNSTTLTAVEDLVLDEGRGRWVLAGKAYGTSDPALATASVSDPTVWSAQDPFESLPDDVYMQQMDIVLDPVRDNRVATAWYTHEYVSGYWEASEVRFDAEWRGDPGWPVPLAGFPVNLHYWSGTDACLADLDGDDDLEIICGYGTSRLGAWHHDGTAVDGWPLDMMGHRYSEASIAIGDLDGDGVPLVVVGTSLGDVMAVNPDGTVAWVALAGNPPGQAFVSIGAFGGPEPRQIAVLQNKCLFFLDSDGELPPGTDYRFYFGSAGEAIAPAAIGDLDGDGLPEAVFSLDTDVFAVSMRPGGNEWSRRMAAPITGPPALLDIDDDDDVEVALTTRDGRAYLLDNGGVDHSTGWPVDTGTGVSLTGVAAASILPGDSWELVFIGADNQIHCVGKDGSTSDGFPVTMPADVPLTPVLAPLDGDAAELLFPDLDGALHAWHYKGGEMPGWPQPITPGLAISPSVGDLDNDGILDAVWLAEGFIFACSLGQPSGGPRDAWPMAYYDAKRSSCIDCDENLVSAVGEEEAATLVSFAAPQPNPVHDRTVFSFMLPQSADVALDVYDLRGRRVATLLNGRLEPGQHLEAWTGHDNAGRAAASGHYVARLRVDGEVLSRKITLVR